MSDQKPTQLDYASGESRPAKSRDVSLAIVLLLAGTGAIGLGILIIASLETDQATADRRDDLRTGSFWLILGGAVLALSIYWIRKGGLLKRRRK